jgi:RNA polymerase sigma factor (sigma-70 family)
MISITSPSFVNKISRLITMLCSRYMGDRTLKEDLSQEAWVVVLERLPGLVNMDEEDAMAYLIPFMRKAILNYSIANRRIVSFAKTKDDYKAICNIKKLMSGKDSLSESDASKFAKTLSVKVDSIRLAFECLYGVDEPADSENCEVFGKQTQSNVIDITAALANRKSERALQIEAIYLSVNELPDDEMDIMNRRWLCDKQETLKSISLSSGLSVSGVAFVESRAIERVKKNVGQFC